MPAARVPSAAVALAGALALAAAMGIGRFAFTPLLPLMLREGQLDMAMAGWLAAANYAGYLAGALSAARLPLSARALALVALAATVVLAAAMAWPLPSAWLLLRFAAGAASAWVFVATSAWCLEALAQRGASSAAGVVYAGVGFGIAAAGLHVWLAAPAGAGAGALWLQLAALALAAAAVVAVVVRRLPPGPLRSGAPTAPRAPTAPGMDSETRGLVACYGIMGFGYILPATFLPAMARSLVDDPRLFGMAWPVFGATAAASTLAVQAWLRRATRLQVWAACQALMGLGVLLPAVWMHSASLALCALLVGGTFMVVTLMGVQEMRARAPAAATAAWVGHLTAAFAAGQIAGPVASALLLQWPALAGRGLPLALLAAALALLASAGWLARRTRQPVPERTHA